MKHSKVNKESLLYDLNSLGLNRGDTLVLHSSMKAIGGGNPANVLDAEDVVDALMEFTKTNAGMLVLPTHTWKQMGPGHNIFDSENEPSCVGIITEIFRKRYGVVRSLHPTHSVAVYADDHSRASHFIANEEKCTTPCTPGGCWSRLEEEHAKILLAGVGHEKNTFIHAVEETLNVPERFTEKPETFYIKKKDDSKLVQVNMYRHFNKNTAHISETYVKLEQAFFDNGCAKRVKLGQADCILCDAYECAQVIRKILSHQINCLIELEELPVLWWS